MFENEFKQCEDCYEDVNIMKMIVKDTPEDEALKKQEKQQKQEDTELKRINGINEREDRFKRKERERKRSIEKEIQINRFNNEKKIIEDLK